MTKMEASDSSSVAAARLKREDWNRAKHDSVFSDWQILVGPSDWEDYSLGKEGAARYRVHNLPKSFGPGVYELGIAECRTGLGREVGRLNPVVVYLGQADNVRTRLQSYGRTGAHLGNSFEEIFSRGHPIVFRWFPVENKREAEKTEAQILNRFDYAWNARCNGVRRPNDILLKLNRTAANTTQFTDVVRKLLPFGQKQVGISIKASMLPSAENKLSACADEESYNFLSRVFKFSRSTPRLLSDRSIVTEENTSFCGVVLGDGLVCRRPPVDRRKRCAEHKGMRINGSIPVVVPTLVTVGKSERTLGSVSNNLADREGDNHNAQNHCYDSVKDPAVVVQCPVSESFTPICGFHWHDSSPCRRQPTQGKKRCDEHKGMRVRGSISESVTVGKSQNVQKAGLDSSCSNQNSSAFCKPGVVQTQASSESFVVSKNSTSICGVDSGYGIYCTRQPARGKVRCDVHKGLGVNGLVSELVAEEKSHLSGMGWKFSSCEYEHGNTSAPTCGATLHNGSQCRRQPVEGNKRCWQHKGMRADSSSDGCKSAAEEKSHLSGTGWKFSSCEYEYGNTSSPTCGATLHNGSQCRRQAIEGNKRCWQHKGMRADSYSDGFVSKLAAEEKSHLSGTGWKFSSCEYEYGNSSAPTCGATLRNGSQCRRQPIEGNKRCWQHKGMRGR